MTMAAVNTSPPLAAGSAPGLDDQAAENWARYNYGKDRGHLEYMEKARRNEDMYLGDGGQWSEADKAVMARARRPCYEINEILPAVNSALGYQIQNRLDIGFLPRGGDADMAKATILSKVVKQICDQAGYHRTESQVYADGLIAQRGFFDVRMNFDNNMLGEVDISDLDPMDVIPDPDAKSYDPDKWADVTVTRWLTADEIEQRYGPDARRKAEASFDWGADFGQYDGEPARNKFGERQLYGIHDAYNGADGLRRYRIIDRQKWVYENTPCMVWPTSGDVKTMADMTSDQVARAQADGAQPARRMRRRIRWVVSTWCVTISDTYSPYEHFTVVPYFAIFRRGRTTGMVDNAIGPQMVLNKGVSQFVHILNVTANGGWKVEQNSLTNMDTEELSDMGATTGLVVEYAKGTTPPEKITANAIPTGVDRLIDRATQAVKDVTVPDSMRGLQGSSVSGVAKQADQFASQQQLAVTLDNLAFTRRLMAMRVVKLVQRYYDSYRVFKITDTDPMTGQRVESTVEINKFDPETGAYLNDLTLGTYDVVISEQPMHVTFENSQFQQAMDMRKMGVNIPDPAIIRYSNLADKQEIIAALPKPKPDPVNEAKARLTHAQADKVEADTVNARVTSMFSATQAANVVATNPATSPVADGLLRSAGFQDQDAAPIVPTVATGTPALALPHNTDPLTPLHPDSPALGADRGIETPAADSGPQPGA